MLPSTYDLLESLDLLLEKREHPGVHRYLATHNVVYHGQAGRFRVYSAARAAKPTGTVLDLSKTPRHVETFPDGGKKTTYLPAGAGGSGFHEALYPGATADHQQRHEAMVHRTGADALEGATRADREMDRLGLPTHRATVITTDSPVDSWITLDKSDRDEKGNPAKHTTRKLGNWELKGYAGKQGHYILGHHNATVHHIALNALDPRSRNTLGNHDEAAGHIAHEWVHHHQKNMTKGEREALNTSFTRLLGQSHETGPGSDLARSAFARGYGKKNWKEWQATGIEAAVAKKQRLSRAQTTRPEYAAAPGAVKRLIGAMTPKQPLPEFPT